MIRYGGGDGNDILYGDWGFGLASGGSDTVYGGNGNDTIYGGIANDFLYGDAGTDFITGDEGNDVIKGGSGISSIYAGDGNDTVYYDPTSSDIGAVGNYLSRSGFGGGDGTDTLHLYNKSTAAGMPTRLDITMDSQEGGHISFQKIGGTADQHIDAGTFHGFEKIVAYSAGGIDYTAGMTGYPVKEVVGTAANDTFVGSFMPEKFVGGAGNDEFTGGNGNDTLVSQTNDADRFHFDMVSPQKTTITGFNGAGVPGGDQIFIDDALIRSPTKVTEFGRADDSGAGWGQHCPDRCCRSEGRHRLLLRLGSFRSPHPQPLGFMADAARCWRVWPTAGRYWLAADR